MQNQNNVKTSRMFFFTFFFVCVFVEPQLKRDEVNQRDGRSIPPKLTESEKNKKALRQKE